MEEKTRLYPTAPQLDDSRVENFRLSQLWSIRADLHNQLEKYNKCKNRYKSVYKALNYVQYLFETVGTLGASSSIATLMTGVGAPVSIALGSVSAGVGALGLINHVILKKLIKKINKHGNISMLIDSKYHSMMLLINKALNDNTISQEEFERILNDYQDFKDKKSQLQKIKPTNKEDFLDKKEVNDLVGKLSTLLQKSKAKD
jgi:hypothetical protein